MVRLVEDNKHRREMVQRVKEMDLEATFFRPGQKGASKMASRLLIAIHEKLPEKESNEPIWIESQLA